jgi:hypothetical protein
MNSDFHLPQGVCAVQEASGHVFTPVAGFTMVPVPGQKWTHVCRVACSAEHQRHLMAALVDVCLPDSFYAILTGYWFGDRIDTYLSDFLSRARIEAAFFPHLPTLLEDGMVGHGFACYDADRHEEIFLDDHKELTLLTSSPSAVQEVLLRHGLAHTAALEFLSEHGHAHMNLGGPEATYCHEIIRALDMKKVEPDQV